MTTSNRSTRFAALAFLMLAAASLAGAEQAMTAAASTCGPQLHACNIGNRPASIDASDCQSANGRAFDLYSFGARAGELVTVSLGSAEFGGYVALVNPQGRIVRIAAAKAGERALVSLEAPADGVYDVIASTAGPGERGGYSVSVSCQEVAPPSFAPCVEGEGALCLGGGRFRVEAWWSTADGRVDRGAPGTISDDTGWFSFFREGTVEAVVKVLDGCEVNGFAWVFAGGLTDAQAAIRVTDTETQAVAWYFNPLGTPFQPVQDTAALPCG